MSVARAGGTSSTNTCPNDRELKVSQISNTLVIRFRSVCVYCYPLLHHIYIYLYIYIPTSITFKSQTHKPTHTHNVVPTRNSIRLRSSRLDSIKNRRGGDLFGTLVRSLSGLPSGLASVGDQSGVIYDHGDCL